MLGVAHRAGNDLATLLQAAAVGADIIEADVHLRRGRLEVRHEKALGPLPLRWDKGRLMRADPDPLLLGPLLDALPARTTVMLDLKGVGRVGTRTAQLLRARPPEHPLLVCARWWPSVQPFRALPWAKVALSARGRTELARLLRALESGMALDGVSVHLSMLTPAVVARLRRRVPMILTWPVDDDESLARARALDVDGAITKSLEVLQRVVSSSQPPAP